MKNTQFVGKIRYLTFLLVAIQGILLLLMATFNLGQSYNNAWNELQYSQNKYTFYIKNNSINKKEEILNIFDEYPDLFIITSKINNETEHQLFGIIGSKNNFPEVTAFDHTVISKNDIELLTENRKELVTTGAFNGSIYSVKNVPDIFFSNNHSLVNLSDYMDITKSVNGVYTVYGISNESIERNFLKDLSRVTNQSVDSLKFANSGTENESGLVPIILSCLIVLTLLTQFTLFVSIAISNLKKFGNLTLLGWTKATISKQIFSQFIVFSIFLIPLLALTFWLISGWKDVSLKVLSQFFLVGIINVVLILVIILISTLVVFSIKPVDAIKGKFPTLALYFIGSTGYILLSSLLVVGSIYLDSPMKEVTKNVEIREQWTSVSEYYTLRDVNIGNDISTVSGQSNELNQDFFNWYRSIREDPSVFIATTDYMSKDILNFYRENEIYKNVPDEAFWYMTYSPNYLREIGIEVDDALINEAEAGTKVFLIPDTLSKKEKSKVEAFLKESESSEYNESDIPTSFNEKNKFKFIDFKYNTKVFNWSHDPEQDILTNNPVIYIITPENMAFRQSESLRSNNLNSFIKFKDKDTADKYTSKEYLSKYNLSDNKLTFVKVEEYIDGLQKDLTQTILWFSGAILGALLLSILLLLSLAYVYRLSNNEKLYVSKFLGFDFFKMYTLPLISILFIWTINIIVVSLSGSKIGIILIIIYGIIQLSIFYFYMTKNDTKQLLLSIKEK